MRMFLAGKMILSPLILVIFLVIVIVGYVIVHLVATHKWGFTPKREKELERDTQKFQFHKKKKNGPEQK